MSTGERIAYEALVLFSKKGYSDVYVAEIASAVGIKAPSLYKHFKSKQDIFDKYCVEDLNVLRLCFSLKMTGCQIMIRLLQVRTDYLNVLLFLLKMAVIY